MRVFDHYGRLKISTTGGISVVDPRASITIENPTNAEDATWFYTNQALDVTELVCVLVGTGSIKWHIRFGPDRSATGTEIVTAGTTTNNTTTGDVVTSLDEDHIPAHSWIWLETSVKTGSPTQISVTMVY